MQFAVPNEMFTLCRVEQIVTIPGWAGVSEHSGVCSDCLQYGTAESDVSKGLAGLTCPLLFN